MESLGAVRSPFSLCTDYKSSVIDFWHYKTSFTTTLSNFCQLQPENIHSLADLTKKDIRSGSQTQIGDAFQPARGLPAAPRAGTQHLGMGLRAEFWLSRLHSTVRLSIWEAVWYHRPPQSTPVVHSLHLSSLISCKPAQLEDDHNVL